MPDILNTTDKNRGVPFRRNETPALPIGFRVGINSAYDDSTARDNVRSGKTTRQSIPNQSCPDPTPGIAAIDSELAYKKARDWIGRAAGSNAARGRVRFDHGWGKTIIADDALGIVNHEHARKAVTLVGSRKGPKPIVECGLTAIEFVEQVTIIQKLDRR